MGVTVEDKRFRVRVSKDGKRINLGSYDTELKATRALNKWKRENADKPVQELYVIPDEDRGKDYIARPTPKKLTLSERFKNAFSLNRTNTGTKE
jgi:hypothetical protein